MKRSEIKRVEIVSTTSKKVKPGVYLFRLEECTFEALSTGVGVRFILSRPDEFKTCYMSAPIAFEAEDWGLYCVLTASRSEFRIRFLD